MSMRVGCIGFGTSESWWQAILPTKASEEEYLKNMLSRWVSGVPMR